MIEAKYHPKSISSNVSTVCMKLLCKLTFFELLQLECTKCFQNFTCFKKLCFASYSKVSTISASHFDMQCLKIPNKVSECIMQIVLKKCVIVIYHILGTHFHAMRSCKDLTATKIQILVKYSIKMALYVTNVKEVK